MIFFYFYSRLISLEKKNNRVERFLSAFPMASSPEPSLESLALAGSWRAILARVGPPTSSVAAAWRVAALVKLRNFEAAELELERLDLDREVSRGDIPFALRWCAADLPARLGRPADAAAAFARLAAFCDRESWAASEKGEGGGEKAKAAELWCDRAEAACWAAAGVSARSEDPCAARAWARAALDRRAARSRGGRGAGGGVGGVSGSSSSSSSPPSPRDEARQPSWEPPLAAGSKALSAAARLELSLGEPSEARRLFSAAAVAAAKAEAEAAGAGGGGGKRDEETNAAAAAEAARAAALLRLSAGDASRAAAGFNAANPTNPSPTDLNNEALCLLFSGNVSRARSVALESLLLLPPPPPSTSSSSPSPLLFSEAALRTAASLANLAPPAAARAARDALFDAVQAQPGAPPEDLDASFLAAA